jgi:aromatic-L-amino-acid decarboxylase
MTPEQFRTLGHQLIDRIADYRATIDQYPVLAQVAPGEIRARLPQSAPESAENPADLLADLETIILPGLTHWNAPHFYGYFPANADLAAVLGDLLSSGFGALGLNWQAAPALAELEEVMLAWWRQLFGLSDQWQGVIQDTASTATLVALICARERATGFSQVRGGLQGVTAPLIVYTSPQAHSSVVKAALLAGFGHDHVRLVGTDGDYAMSADLLADAIAADLAAGCQPCAVVATLGTTATTALDPVPQIAALAQRHALWLHVDGAMGGAALMLPERAWMRDGLESADSLVINAHKWLGVVFDASLYFVRDADHLVRVMSTSPSYLRTSADGQVKNYRDWGIPLGRRFRALKLWLHLRLHGAEALRERLRRDLANAQWLAQEVEKSADWHLLAPVTLQTVCLRHQPPGLSGDALDAHTLAWVEQINRSGAAYLTPALLDGRWMVRVSIGALPTERHHVEVLWQLLRHHAEADRQITHQPAATS